MGKLIKPCRLEWNNTGAWKLLATFDAANEDAADEILQAAGHLLAAVNDPASGRPCLVSARITTDEQPPIVLMRWQRDACDDAGSMGAWVDARTGEPA